MTRRELLGLAGVLTWALVGGARAATVVPYDAAAFAADQAAGKPILVHVNASWCPNCAKQRPIIDQLAATPEFANLIIMRVDFDSEKPVVRSFGVQMQSTLIVFHGRDERGRATAITDPAAIKALLEKAEG
jgi:thiol-disulfide isomerase/thioredoxin